MADLHVFANEIEWCVAESLEDVEAAMKESIGAVYSPEDEIEWIQMDDDATLAIWMVEGEIAEHGEAGAHVETLTCREWADQQGRGFLASTEY